MRPIDADALAAKCQEIEQMEHNRKTAESRWWALAYRVLYDMVTNAPTITADDYFDAADRIKPCPNCRYTLLGMLDTGEDNNVPTNWHPASEPPKEWKIPYTGCMIDYLAYSQADGATYLANWYKPAQCWMVDGETVAISHWMPLPEAPKED